MTELNLNEYELQEKTIRHDIRRLIFNWEEKQYDYSIMIDNLIRYANLLTTLQD
jgi:hypothetical protein